MVWAFDSRGGRPCGRRACADAWTQSDLEVVFVGWRDEILGSEHHLSILEVIKMIKIFRTCLIPSMKFTRILSGNLPYVHYYENMDLHLEYMNTWSRNFKPENAHHGYFCLSDIYLKLYKMHNKHQKIIWGNKCVIFWAFLKNDSPYIAYECFEAVMIEVYLKCSDELMAAVSVFGQHGEANGWQQLCVEWESKLIFFPFICCISIWYPSYMNGALAILCFTLGKRNKALAVISGE